MLNLTQDCLRSYQTALAKTEGGSFCRMIIMAHECLHRRAVPMGSDGNDESSLLIMVHQMPTYHVLLLLAKSQLIGSAIKIKNESPSIDIDICYCLPALDLRQYHHAKVSPCQRLSYGYRWRWRWKQCCNGVKQRDEWRGVECGGVQGKAGTK